MKQKATFAVSGMHCASCAMNIDGELEDTPGVERATTSYAAEKTDVVFDDTMVAETDIVAIIGRVGYAAAKINE